MTLPPPPRPDADEEELRTDSGGLARPVRLALGALLVAALVTAGVLVVHGGNAPHHRAAPPTPVASSRSTPQVLAACPADATCTTTSDLPLTVTSALRDAFPDAVLTSSVSLLANRTGHFEPDLVARRLAALVGPSATLTLHVLPTPAGVLPSGSRVVQAVATATGARAEGRVDGFVVTGTVSGPSPVADRMRAAAVRALGHLVVAGALTDAQ